MDAPRSQSSFSRGLDVLIAVARRGQTTVAEVSEELGLPSSTTYRYIRSLRDYGLLEEVRGVYLPGWRLMEVAGHHLTHTKLAELGADYLKALSYQTSETAVLAVRAGSHAICLRQVVSVSEEHHAFRINELLPLHAGAGQRLLLAYAPKPIIELVGMEVDTLADARLTRESLLASLDSCRRDRMALSRGEFQPGALAIAVPVFVNGEAACSLTVAGPAARCDHERWLKKAARLLRDAAVQLGEDLEKSTP